MASEEATARTACPTPFRASLPLTATSFVNKTGAIGLNLLPMVLVERQVGVGESSAILAVTKGMALAATFVGGWASDRVSTKALVLGSFALSAIGLSGLASSRGVAALAAFAVLAQLGNSLFNSPARLMLARMVPGASLQESIAWLRTANNLGQVMSYSVGALVAGMGIGALMLYDAATSALAFAFGTRWLPSLPPGRDGARPKSGNNTFEAGGAGWGALTGVAFLLFGSSLVYELFIAGASGQYRLLYGPEGLRIFSLSMVVNTILCAGFAVVAARFFERPSRALPIGLALQGVGGAIATHPIEGSVAGIYGGMFLLSVGEIVFASMSQATLIRTLPEGRNRRNRGSVYGLAMTAQVSGRVVGSALAFPWIVHGHRPGLTFLLVSAPFFVLGTLLGSRLDASSRA